jgi:hypothetical protein
MLFLPQLCAAVPQYFQATFLWLKMTKQVFGLRTEILGRQTGRTYGFLSFDIRPVSRQYGRACECPY